MTIELPQDRVRAFATEMKEWGDDHIATTGEYSSPVRYSLTNTDLTDVLDELDAHQELLIEIDKVLDQSWLYESAEAPLAAIRDLMGNHTNGREA